MFAGAYQGHFDATPALPGGADPDAPARPLAPGIAPNMVADALVLLYGEAESIETLRARAGELAAILVEPVQSQRPDLQPREFLLAPPAIRVKALPHRYVDMQGTEVERIDPARVNAALPPIIRGYLHLGAVVGEGAVIDEQFNTIDVSVVLRAERALRAFDGGTAVRSSLLAADTAGREHAS